MFQLLRNWVRGIVKEEIYKVQLSKMYPLTTDRLETAIADLDQTIFQPGSRAVLPQGEIIKLNPVENYLKENSDKEVSIGEILQEE